MRPTRVSRPSSVLPQMPHILRPRLVRSTTLRSEATLAGRTFERSTIDAGCTTTVVTGAGRPRLARSPMTAPLPNSPPPGGVHRPPGLRTPDLGAQVPDPRPGRRRDGRHVPLLQPQAAGLPVVDQVFVGQAERCDGRRHDPSDQDRVLANQARLLQTAEVAARVARKIGLRGRPARAARRHLVTAAEGSDFVTITQHRRQPPGGGAARQRLRPGLHRPPRRPSASKQTQSSCASLQRAARASASGPARASPAQRSARTRINQLQLARSTPAGEARQIDERSAGGAPRSRRKPQRNALFAFALSLLLGIIAAFGLERIDRRLRTVDDAEPRLRAARHRGDPARARHRGRASDGEVSVAEGVRETFRSLRSNLDFAAGRAAAADDAGHQRRPGRRASRRSCATSPSSMRRLG